MGLSEAIVNVLANAGRPLTPQEIRELVKSQYPELYGTDSHTRNVEKGYYHDLDHALLAQIYTVVGSDKKMVSVHFWKMVSVHFWKMVSVHFYT